MCLFLHGLTLFVFYFVLCAWVFAYMHVSLWCTCLLPVEAIKRLWVPCICGCRQWVLSTQPSPLQAQWVFLTVDPPASFFCFSQSFPKNMGPLTHCWLLKKEVTDSRKMVKWVLFLWLSLFRYVISLCGWRWLWALRSFCLSLLHAGNRRSMCYHIRPLHTSELTWLDSYDVTQQTSEGRFLD